MKRTLRVLTVIAALFILSVFVGAFNRVPVPKECEGKNICFFLIP